MYHSRLLPFRGILFIFGVDLVWWVGLIPISIFWVAAILIATRMHRKCGPNQAMLITGLFAGHHEVTENDRSLREFTIIVGRGAIVLLMVQQAHFLSLEIMSTKVQSKTPMITRDGVQIFIEGVAQVKIKRDYSAIAIAAEHLLGKSEADIVSVACESLVSYTRAVVGTKQWAHSKMSTKRVQL